jgi:hypothetical protein
VVLWRNKILNSGKFSGHFATFEVSGQYRSLKNSGISGQEATSATPHTVRHPTAHKLFPVKNLTTGLGYATGCQEASYIQT